MRFVDPAALGACVHCGLCLASCPTYVTLGTEADSPRGRIHLMRALEAGTVDPSAEVIRHLDTCLGCRACETACPSGVAYGALIEAARPFVEPHRSTLGYAARRLLAATLTRPALRRIAFAPVRRVGGAPWLRRLTARVPVRPLAYAAALPPRDRHTALPAILEPDGPARGTVLLLAGCVAETLFGATNRRMALLLRRAGLRVIRPHAQPCCGALALHLGDAETARQSARAVVAVAREVAADWVVTTAAGCGALVREYDRLLPDDVEARALARRARDALALLAELGLPAAVRALPRRIAVHDPCHLAHGQGVRTEVRALLATIAGVRLVELGESDWCCGSAGTYNLTEPALSARLAARKLERIVESTAEVVAAANPGCLLQIRAAAIVRGLPVAIEHPVDLLAVAQGID